MELFKTASYYAKPEGEDYTGKMVATNRHMLLLSLPFASMDVLMYTKPTGYLATIARYGKWVLPAMGMASMFTTGVYATTNLRGKCGKLNYVVGAVGAAAVFGKAIKNPVTGLHLCAVFSIAAIAKKISIDEGWTWFPTPEHVMTYRVYGSHRTPGYDFTIMKDTPEKGWTTNRDEA